MKLSQKYDFTLWQFQNLYYATYEDKGLVVTLAYCPLPVK